MTIEHIEKTRLLSEMDKGFAEFEALLSQLSPQQMTTPDVNGPWAVKDNLTHLSAWHLHLLGMLQAAKNGTRFVDPHPHASEDEANEYYFQQSKNLPLDTALAEFRSSYQQVRTAVEALSEEELNQPLDWLRDRPVWPLINGNTYGHYEEHGKIIQSWLASKSGSAVKD